MNKINPKNHHKSLAVHLPHILRTHGDQKQDGADEPTEGRCETGAQGVNVDIVVDVQPNLKRKKKRNE